MDEEKAAWHAHCLEMTSELSLRNLQNFNFVSKTNISKLLSTPIRICFQLESVYSCSYGESKQASTDNGIIISIDEPNNQANERAKTHVSLLSVTNSIRIYCVRDSRLTETHNKGFINQFLIN